MTILILDNNEILLNQTVRKLAREKHGVRAAGSIQEAREVLSSRESVVLCLDLQLQDGDGMDLVESLREEGREFPTVIFSNRPSSESSARARQLGVTEFTANSLASSELEVLLAELLETPKFNSTQPKPDGLESESSHLDEKGALSLFPLEASRIARAKQAYATRRVPIGEATQLITGDYAPQVGDIVLARVDKLNQHKRLELTNGRRATLYQADEIVVCYGNRYAPDQFEAEVPSDLSPCHLVAAGGIAADCKSRNSSVRLATRITPIGVMAQSNGWPLNLADFAVESRPAPPGRPPVTAIVGTSMNAGKTTTAAHLALGMTRRGLKVGAAKVTGTGAGCDVWRMEDAGCHSVLDFTDCGVPSTYRLPALECDAILETLVAHLSEDDFDAVIIEVADGILQAETRALVTSSVFARLVDQVVFAAGDALSAAAGVDWLEQQGARVVGVSGALTAAPLTVSECASLVSQPVLTTGDLTKGKLSEAVTASCQDGTVVDTIAA